MYENGGSSKEIQRMVQAGALTWLRVEGIMWDRKLKIKTKRKRVGRLRGNCLYILVGNTDTDKETGGEDTDSRKQLGSKNMQSNPRIQKMKELREEISMKKHLK